MAKTNKKTTAQKTTSEPKKKVEGAGEKRVRLYLEARAKEDSEFAKMYANPEKTLDKCIQYMMEQARKQAQNGCAFVDDDTAFGWAVHYYNEPDLQPKGDVKATMGTTSVKPEPTKKVEQKKEEVEDDLLSALDALEL